MPKTLDLYFQDLTPEAQQRLVDFLGDNGNYDVVTSKFVEELDNQFIEHENDSIWLHGKIYRRSFLINKNISFNSTRNNEDNGFNHLIIFMDGNIFYLNLKRYI